MCACIFFFVQIVGILLCLFQLTSSPCWQSCISCQEPLESTQGQQIGCPVLLRLGSRGNCFIINFLFNLRNCCRSGMIPFSVQVCDSTEHGCLGCVIHAPWFSIKMASYQERKSYFGDKMITRSFYFYSGNSYAGKTASLQLISPMIWHDIR